MHMNCRALAAMLILLPALIAACGGGSELPPPPPCPAATPTPQFPTTPTTSFFTAVRRSHDQLASLLASFRAAYPGGKFYRSDGFRDDFNTYSGSAACVLTSLQAIRLAANASQNAKDALAAYAPLWAEYQNVLNEARSGVARRSTSDYRDFNKDVDALAVKLSDVVPRSRPGSQ
jgi:hypothetical protein